MLAHAAPKILLPASEPGAAKWISDAIGQVEMERVKETKYVGPLARIPKSLGYHTERRTEPLVLPSEITGLQRLHAFLKDSNMVVPFGFPYTAPLKPQQGFVPRATAPRVV